MPSNPWLQLDRKLVGDIYTSAEARANLLRLCDDFGSRFGGTPGEKAAAEFMRQRLSEYGLHNARLEPFEYLGWHRGDVELEILTPVQKRIDCISLPHSPPADLEGVVIDLGDGSTQDFERLSADISGRIVMTTSAVQPRGMRRWVHRNEKYGRSLLAGASAFIFVNHYPGYGPATGGVGNQGREGLIPAISLSLEDGAYLQRLMERFGEVHLRLRSTARSELMTSWNVLADWPGDDNASEIVMLGCHYDGHDISQGAADPISGAIALMEAARTIAAHAGPRSRTLRFALWGVEEIGLLGSRAYVKRHESELDDHFFYLNMDMAGGVSSKDIVLNEWPELEPLFLAWNEEMAADFDLAQSVHAHSDHFPFLNAGVVTAGIESADPNLDGRGYGHTRYDTVDKVQISGAREAAALAARLAIRLADCRTWPVARRSTDDVAALLNQPAYQEEAELSARVRAVYQQAGDQ